MAKVIQIAALLLSPVFCYYMVILTPWGSWSTFNVGFALPLMTGILWLFPSSNIKERLAWVIGLIALSGVSIIYAKVTLYAVYIGSASLFISAATLLITGKLPIILRFLLSVVGSYHASIYIVGQPSWYLSLSFLSETPELAEGTLDGYGRFFVLGIIVFLIVFLTFISQKFQPNRVRAGI